VAVCVVVEHSSVLLEPRDMAVRAPDGPASSTWREATAGVRRPPVGASRRRRCPRSRLFRRTSVAWPS